MEEKNIAPKKVRDSNIELLRLTAMFLVLVVHSDFFSLGQPTLDDATNHSVNALARYFFQALSIVCVDVFVLISGCFGIHPSKKSFCNFIFQCLFFLVGIYGIMLLTGHVALSAKGIAECLAMTHSNWFIKSYIGLYILAPVLNAFVERTKQDAYAKVLIAFFVFQSLYAFVSFGAAYFEGGYSAMSFIGLYLLARYVRIYRPRWSNFTPPLLCVDIFGYDIDIDRSKLLACSDWNGWKQVDIY